jgi:uncharacterized protein involved in response to NO
VNPLARNDIRVSPPPLWRAEPFRVFFPLAMLAGSYGVGHWVLYATGILTEYSCLFHGLIQTQAFVIALVLGFLLTAIPRRTQTQPADASEVFALVGAVMLILVAATIERWVLAEASYVAAILLLLRFAVRRFMGSAAGRRPPAAFVLIPLGLLHGLIGAGLLIATFADWIDVGAVRLGRLFVEQGVILCLAIGAGSLVLPLMSGSSPPPDLGSSPRETRRAVAYAAVGLAIMGSLLAEWNGAERWAAIARGLLVAGALPIAAGATRPPGKPGVHRWLVWIAVWLMPVGLIASGMWPDYRVPALHILFIGGFSLLGFGVATHVAFAHSNREDLALGRPVAVVLIGVLLLLAMAGRVAADWAATYFEHLAMAATAWIAAALLWIVRVWPRNRKD